MTFALAGKLSATHTELKEVILQNGGTYSDLIVSNVCDWLIIMFHTSFLTFVDRFHDLHSDRDINFPT
jgi:hypothetical protein